MISFGRIIPVLPFAVRAVLVIATALLIYSSYSFGVDRGHDTITADLGDAHFRLAVCGILTVQKYGGGRYACDTAAYQNMKAVGMDYEEDTLARVRAVKVHDKKGYSLSFEKGLRSLFNAPSAQPSEQARGLGYGSDSGYMDFVELAFFLFGEKVSSLYYAFFILLIASTVLFLLTFPKSLWIFFTAFVFHYVVFRRNTPLSDSIKRCWPGLVVFVCLMAGLITSSMLTDPRLAAGGYTMRHTLSLTTYRSLEMHPDWKEKYQAQHGMNTGSDAIPMVAARNYAKRHGLEGSINWNQKTREKYIGAAFVEFFKNDPVYVLETFFYYNPTRILSIVSDFISRLFSTIGLHFALIFSLMVTVITREVIRERMKIAHIFLGTIALFSLSVFSASPSSATLVIASSLNDTFILVGMSSIATVFLAFVCLSVFAVRALQRKGWISPCRDN